MVTLDMTVIPLRKNYHLAPAPGLSPVSVGAVFPLGNADARFTLTSMPCAFMTCKMPASGLHSGMALLLFVLDLYAVSGYGEKAFQSVGVNTKNPDPVKGSVGFFRGAGQLVVASA